MTTLRRFARFNVVGLIGIGVQVATITALVEVAGLHYAWATAAGVVMAVVHNFVWHVRWTWRDRAPEGRRLAVAFVTFAGANGVISLVGNLALMPVLVAGAGLAIVPANLLAIVGTGLVNFAVGGRVCFPQVSTGRDPSPNLWKTDPSPYL